MSNDVEAEFLGDLCPNIRPLAEQILVCQCGCQLLDFLRTRPRSWLEASDIAFHIGESPEEVVTSLNRLSELELVERREILGMTVYGLTSAQAQLAALEQFWVWRDVWRDRWQQTRNALKFQGP